jgi:hypothetical protein
MVQILSLSEDYGVNPGSARAFQHPGGCFQGGACGQHIIYQHNMCSLDALRSNGAKGSLELFEPLGPVRSHLMRLAATGQ